MTERFLMKETDPAAFKVMLALEDYLETTSISALHHEMIRIRASQINGCGYCINAHTQDARKLGETEQRIYLLSVWREAPQFTEEERVILALTEEVTLIHQQGLTAATYEKAVQHFGVKGTAELIMAVNTINAWNRIGISSHRIPGK
ncbi:MAG: carboxymuconolactone decarboxylase family protein [Chitinophaga sp.]|uniref:carboxymuconolactone decarboxylase family protein n=1 Tax=Chitinophaga sp. TaxID=1869181 RepID=UPI001B212B5E|nr:carboxymuconolactone decarboxylase family protein [Chitinophaga sp.]MBO9727370.1 carboxymuconolactone decarboxylase family protein [Chitinophaga sp.]